MIAGDVLRVDLHALLGAAAPVTVVANLPYNISTPVLMQLLGEPELFDRLVLMLQREVAERICAAAGQQGVRRAVGRRASRRRRAHRLARAADRLRAAPEGRVGRRRRSSRAAPCPSARRSGATLRHVVRTAFSRRRKQLANVIAPLTRDPRAVLAGSASTRSGGRRP